MANSILTSDKNHLTLLDSGVVVNKELFKYSSIKKELAELKKKENEKNYQSSTEPMVSPDGRLNVVNLTFENNEKIGKLKDYELIKDGDIHQINIMMNKSTFNEIISPFNTFEFEGDIGDVIESGSVRSVSNFHVAEQKPPKKKSLCRKLFEAIGKTIKEASKEEKETYVLDVLQFFSSVKGITKENVDSYVNRLVGYIVALKNCEVTGQTALKEKLLRDMIINRYESVLYANNLYYVITEKQIVDFVKKTEKGVQLTYVKNYMRAIPVDVIDKIHETDKLEIFDNYAILHYDPDSKSYAETIAETKKRRDPILFGLIKGSNKLYYITDWVDEYCDLTLDKFVEILQIEKESLKMNETLN